MSVSTDFSRMILSASGWRMVFSADGDENGMSEKLSASGELICTAVAAAFAGSFGLKKGDRILRARDARPTGKTICDVTARTLAYLGLDVQYAGICSAPETMAESATGDYSAFYYVSASHNPAGHNGFKFGRNGGVFGQKEIAPAIELLRKIVRDEETLENLYSDSRKAYSGDFPENSALKRKSLTDYIRFICRTTCPDGSIDSLRAQIAKKGIGICADLNGSARAVSVDRDFLAWMGFKTCFINDEAGKIAHGIIPEGKNLEPCRELLERLHAEDPDFVLGYVPDNDGDRGNVVYMAGDGKARVLLPQEVFALCVESVLRYSSMSGAGNLAVAVNGPTSMRIDSIASRYGARTFRAEVGEANAVNLADSLRERGFNVPILGEGSNGGNITYPARVRDPMNTLMCLTRILLSDSIDSAFEKLPPYITTSATDPRAILHLQTQDYRNLKKQYEELFPSEFENNRELLSGYGITSWKEYQTEGIVERCEAGNGDKGGLKICFFNGKEEVLAYIWMRPSGTEPLFRIICDVRGNDERSLSLHNFLIEFQKELILKAQACPGTV